MEINIKFCFPKKFCFPTNVSWGRLSTASVI